MGIWDRLLGRGSARRDDAQPDGARAGAPGRESAPRDTSAPREGDAPREAVRLTVGWRELDAALEAATDVLDHLAQRVREAAQGGERDVHVGVLATASPRRRWEYRETAEAFGRAVPALHAELARRGAAPHLWLTLRPWHTVAAGEPGDAHVIAPPWRQDPAVVARAHHGALAHGLAARGLAEAGARSGLVLDLAVHVPADERRGADLDAVHAADVRRNHLVVGPLLEGALPRDLVTAAGVGAGLAVVRPGDLAVARARTDVLCLVPPETWVLRGEGGRGDTLDVATTATPADPADAARALHDQLRAFDVAHEGTGLLVDLSGVGSAEMRERYEGAVRAALGDGIPIRAVVREVGDEIVATPEAP